MTSVKEGVDICNLSVPMMLAVHVLQTVFREQFKADLVITSGRDGTHRHVLHYVGCAIDFRIHHLVPGDLASLEGACQAALGGQYDVVLESDHLHVEFDPRT